MGYPSWSVLATAFSSLLVFLTFQGVKRLFFHPLTQFPGPPLAALTLWYKAYYDIIMDGGWSAHLDYLHETYGKILF